jgi:hypothetical protein
MNNINSKFTEIDIEHSYHIVLRQNEYYFKTQVYTNYSQKDIEKFVRLTIEQTLVQIG